MIVSIGNSDCINLTFTKYALITDATEYWYLKDPHSGEILYNSWIPGNSTTETQTHCVPIPGSYVYDLVFPDLFYDGSWLEIKGPYDQIFFKGVKNNPAIAVSVYTPITKGSTWTILLQRELHWTDLKWDSYGSTILSTGSLSSWNAANNNNPRRMFLRKEFSTLADLAAYEFRFKYKYGIIAYMNGYEVYRDNLPNGYFSEDIPPTMISFYNSYEFRGAIRNAGELLLDNVLSIELYSQEVIKEFDGWLSMYASAWGKDHFAKIYFHPVTGAYKGSKIYKQPTDFFTDSFVYATGDESGTNAHLDYDIRGQANSIFYFVRDSGAMSRVVVSGTTLKGTLIEIEDFAIDAEYDSNVIYRFATCQHNFKMVRINGYSTTDYLQFNELIPVILSTKVTFPSYPTTELTYSYSINELIHESLGDHHCQLMPTQVTGLIVYENCTITGIFTSPGTKEVSVMIFVLDDKLMNTFYVTLSFFVNGTPKQNNNSSHIFIIVVLVVIIIFLILLFLFFFRSKKKQLPVKDQKDLPKTMNVAMVSPSGHALPNSIGNLITPANSSELHSVPIRDQPPGFTIPVQPSHLSVIPQSTQSPLMPVSYHFPQSQPVNAVTPTIIPMTNQLAATTPSSQLINNYSQSIPNINSSNPTITALQQQQLNLCNQPTLTSSVMYVQQPVEVPFNQNPHLIPDNQPILLETSSASQNLSTTSLRSYSNQTIDTATESSKSQTTKQKKFVIINKRSNKAN